MKRLISPEPHRAYSKGFYTNDDFDYSVRCVLGGSSYGASEPGEVFATIADVGDGDHEAWFDAWLATGKRVRAEADASREAGRTVSAASSYLRAATYFAVAVDAVSALGNDDQLLPTFQLHRSSWDGFVDTCGRSVERISIPFDGDTLPGYLFRPAAAPEPTPPTLVMVNGSDGALTSLWCSGAAGALERGYNVLIFDGPGQQSMLFEKGVGFRPDWAPVLGAVVDDLAARPGIDPDRLALYGISQGGYWIANALTTEKRFVAAIADPGVTDIVASWEANIPSSLMKLFHAGKRDSFDRDMGIGMRLSGAEARTWRFRARPYGQDSYFDTLTEVSRYTLTDDEAAQITTPLLITEPEREQFWPGQSKKMADAVGGPVQVVPFTSAEGADFHCQPMARRLTDERMFAWLDEQLGE